MTPEEYEAKRQARYDRLINAAERAERESDSMWKTAHNMADAIPFGQPILVGHHSERRDRNYRAKIESKHRKGYELHQRAEELKSRAEAAANNTAIFSDDPQASEKISEKIARLEKRQELMKKVNALVRKNDHAGIVALGFSETRATELLTGSRWDKGFPAYKLTNNGAEIRRLKARLETIEARKDDETKEIEPAPGIRIVDNVEENRLQIHFPGKPSEEVRAELKRHGFRWSPSNQTWQAYRGNNAIYYAKEIVKKHYS